MLLLRHTVLEVKINECRIAKGLGDQISWRARLSYVYLGRARWICASGRHNRNSQVALNEQDGLFRACVQRQTKSGYEKILFRQRDELDIPSATAHCGRRLFHYCHGIPFGLGYVLGGEFGHLQNGKHRIRVMIDRVVQAAGGNVCQMVTTQCGRLQCHERVWVG